MLAVQFGAGNIGRGFIAALLRQSGYEVIFADVVDSIVNQINQEKKYCVKITDINPEEILIDGVSAVDSKQDISYVLKNADVITTAVGVNILPKIAPSIASGIIAKRAEGIDKLMNIIACENAVMATNNLKDAVYDLLDEDDKKFADEHVGFANCSVDRIVPPACETNGLDVCVERFFEWNICESELKGSFNIKGANLVDNLEAYVERKLFTLNTGHAITAYLGFLDGKNTIEEAINCETIYKVVKAAMIESGSGLCKKHGFDKDKHNSYIDKIIDRFKNPYLKDDVNRVGREPLRKLSISDRLVKPTLTALQYELPVDNLIKGIAAALHFNNPVDAESVEMQQKIASLGFNEAVADITGIFDKELLAKIEAVYLSFLNE